VCVCVLFKREDSEDGVFYAHILKVPWNTLTEISYLVLGVDVCVRSSVMSCEEGGGDSP